MSEKTITQLALDAGVETGGTENALAILKFAQMYADQEKRSTAIAFKKWCAEHEAVIDYADQRSYSDEEYYEMFLNSLPK